MSEHLWDQYRDFCVRCGTSDKAERMRPSVCVVHRDALHINDSGGHRGMHWHGKPGYFYACKACDFCVQIGTRLENGVEALGAGIVHECRHGNRGFAELSSPLEVIVEFLVALHKRPLDRYKEHAQKLALKGIEALHLEPPDEPLGDAWATSTWEWP